jgi:hypothetical protein
MTFSAITKLAVATQENFPMPSKRIRLALVVLGLMSALSGCQRSLPEPVDPNRAREALRTALNAWQNGDSADALQDRSSITAADPKWQDGHNLIRYEIADQDQVVGCDLHCRVLLVLKQPDGQQIQEQVVYCVSTSGALVVVRADS